MTQSGRPHLQPLGVAVDRLPGAPGPCSTGGKRTARRARGAGQRKASNHAGVADRGRLAVLDMQAGNPAEARIVRWSASSRPGNAAARPRAGPDRRHRARPASDQHRPAGPRRPAAAARAAIRSPAAAGRAAREDGTRPAAPPNPFRKTPQFHERRLTGAFRTGSSRIGQKGVMSKAGPPIRHRPTDEGVGVMFKKIALSTAVAVVGADRHAGRRRSPEPQRLLAAPTTTIG